jgi:hypothetical protein
MGAPRKNPPKDAAEVIERLAAAGHAIVGIAKQLGVVRETFKRWCEEDESLQEAFELGRETERQMLHALIVQSAAKNLPANVNAFFILKSRHFYRENEPSQVNVGVAVTSHVMVMKDHGDDATWAAKAAEQQRKLGANEPSPAPAPKLPTPSQEIEEAVIVPQRLALPSWLPLHVPANPALTVVLLDDLPFGRASNQSARMAG